jgi:exopolysaccharide production protein ExoQ
LWAKARTGLTSKPLLIALALVLMAATDLKVRVRAASSTVSGRLDVFVLAELALFAAVAAVVIGFYPARVLDRSRIRLVPALTGLFVGDLLLSVTYSPFTALAVVRATELVVWCVLALQLRDLGDLETLHRLAHGFVVMVSMAVLWGFLFRRPAVGLERDRFSWLSVHPVVAASWLGIGATLLVAYLLAASRGRRFAPWHPNVYLILLVIQVAALTATRTRGAMAAFVCASVTVVAGHVSPRRRREFVFVGAAVALSVWVIASGPIQDFIARGETATRLSTLNGRTQLWKLAWIAIQQRPWFGHGMAASRGLFLDRTTLGGAHNAAVNVLVDQGAVGLALYAALCLALLVTLTRQRSGIARTHALPARAVLVFLVVHGLTVEYMVAPVMASFAWFLLVAVWARLVQDLSVRRT